MSAYDCECGGIFERIPVLTEEEGNELEEKPEYPSPETYYPA